MSATRFRTAIQAQLRAERADWPDFVTCHRCGCTLPVASSHVDHHPRTFAVLLRSYLDMAAANGLPVDMAQWRQYHRRHATYKPACGPCNVAANPRGRRWHERHGRAA